ncbi:MAG: hypothetical protein ACJ74H_02055 [Thermoanaerobaculia bacterium]
MRLTKARTELNEILDALRHWETATPKRARRFHAARQELEKQVRSSLSTWWPWVGDEIVERYRDRARRIDEVAEALIELIRDAERLETEVRELEENLALGDAQVITWMRGLCRDWIATLGRLGTACDRKPDLFAEQSVLVGTQSAVRLHEEAFRELCEVDRVVTAIGDGRSIALTGRRPELLQRLYAGGATRPWLIELRELLEPLKTIADRVVDPPQELRSLAQTLADARSWSSRLGDDAAQELQQLTERRFTAPDLQPEDVQALVEDANTLRARLIARANDVRGDRLATLRLQMNDLRHACGPQWELDEKFADLEAMRSDHPHLFRDWLGEADVFLEHFHAIAQTHRGEIETLLHEVLAKLETKIEELERLPLSNDVRDEVTIVRSELARFPRSSLASDELLPLLRRTEEFTQHLGDLTARAHRDLQDLDASQQQLSVRNDRLQAEAGKVKRLKIAATDLSPRIAELSAGSAGVSLEERRSQIAALTIELDEREAEFVASCREALDSRVEAIERTVRVLRSAGDATPYAQPPSIANGAPLHETTAAVLDARRQHELVLQRARFVAKELEAQRIHAQSELANIRVEDLSPADRETVAALVLQLTSGSAAETRALLERIERNAALRENYTLFFEQLRQEELSARERRCELLSRLRIFNEDQLRRFCPELTERVTALVYGIPEDPRQWAAVHHQLDLARDLFQRVETHARRLAADELERAAETLRQRMRSGSAAFRANAHALLDELDARGNDTLAPATLRLRIVSASQRGG